MPRRSKALLDRAERIARSELPVVALISGDPESARLLGRPLGEREAMIEGELFEALDGETVKQFHRRMVELARERIVTLDRGVRVVSIGDDEPQPVCRYNLDGTPITIN